MIYIQIYFNISNISANYHVIAYNIISYFIQCLTVVDYRKALISYC